MYFESHIYTYISSSKKIIGTFESKYCFGSIHLNTHISFHFDAKIIFLRFALLPYKSTCPTFIYIQAIAVAVRRKTQPFICWEIFHDFLQPAEFFQNQLFWKTFSGIPPDIKEFGSRSGTSFKMSCLIWVQTVCKGYQRTTQAGKELMHFKYGAPSCFQHSSHYTRSVKFLIMFPHFFLH